MTAARRAQAIGIGAPLHYHDGQFDTRAVKLLPADYYVTHDDVALVTVLGSCVSACLRDATAGVGGMNHFLLPDGECADAPARYGTNAMELLINALLAAGASRHRLEAKVFGGGNVLKSFSAHPVGTRNAQFVIDYLQVEGIPVRASDLMGPHPRKIWFFPATGRVVVRRLPPARDAQVCREEERYQARISATPVSGNVELFT
jgi:chemotaxis protein CheD